MLRENKVGITGKRITTDVLRRIQCVHQFDELKFLPVRASRVRQPHHVHTELDWEVWPDALRDILLWVTKRYGRIPLYVTENGAAFFDPPTIDSAVEGAALDDPLRVDYLRKHLRAVHEAIRQGADIRGYFAWSLLDNFEWAHGFSKRFGLVHVDYETLQRTPKASAHFYSQVVASNGAALDEPAAH